MVPRRRVRRPWHRTRAYRLTRTAVLTVVLVTVGVRCGGHDRPATAARPGEAASGGAQAAPAPGADADQESRSAGKKASESPKPPPRPLPRSPATTLRVPSLGIEAPIVPLRLGPDRHLGTPPLERPKLVGWYAGGPTPGERGTAVAVGHRDTKTGPAVFAGLARVARGARIEALRADGRTAVYTVDKVRVFDKATFPDKEVYGPTRRPELRILTCGGLFRHATGYTSNVVVFAHLTATR
ncbi:class F sortase [Streptomyces rishiriensis]|uniref:Sortase (Surface protein transpeptidase) n=1 Tax=Streptomyces rishiriensis TaxID=68264 RepID=A0ABU0NLL0_STRRH|nr:class F sortase [Streptomyces rishiriensis]MDQ0580016.1 sortase (surface protein transpeptidase) [Streptomyces rishiriensis]